MLLIDFNSVFLKDLTVGQFLRNCCTYVEAEPKRQAKTNHS